MSHGQSDLVFAWINSSDPHGTLQEIGYAHGLKSKKKIFTVAAFESLALMREMWFLAESADFRFIAKSAPEAWTKFCDAVTETHGDWYRIRRKLCPGICNNQMLDNEVEAHWAKDENREWGWEMDPYDYIPDFVREERANKGNTKES